MELTENYTNNIYLTLQELIHLKSTRDKKNFTVYQLAKAIGMQHSIIVKLIHTNPNKRVKNPRIDTLTKIVDFFNQDGFNITINDLIHGIKTINNGIDISSQDINLKTTNVSIPIYSMNNGIENNIGYINANLKTEPNYIGSQIAILAEEDIKPIFKKGSIFIIDTKLNPENDTLVAVKKNGDSKILIRKFLICGENIILKSYNDNVNEIILSHNYKIIGVVVNVNTKI